MTDKEPDRRLSETSEEERLGALGQFQAWIEKPMFVLAFVWLILLIIEFVRGLNAVFQAIVTAIWVVFIAAFVLEFILSPRKAVYLRNNIITAVSLFIPALRLFRFARFFRFLRLARTMRGLTLIRVVSSINRSMNELRGFLGSRGFGYVLFSTLVVTFGGAAGMLIFERAQPGGQGLQGYGDAIWWTAMILTTLGSQYWPRTPEGRVLGFLISLYAFAVFGYFTALLASFFVGHRPRAPGEHEDPENGKDRGSL